MMVFSNLKLVIIKGLKFYKIELEIFIVLYTCYEFHLDFIVSFFLCIRFV